LGLVDGLSLRFGFVVIDCWPVVALSVEIPSNVLLFELVISESVPLVLTEMEELLRLSKDLFINLVSCSWELSFKDVPLAEFE